MNNSAEETFATVQFWHPNRGGWHTGTLVGMNGKYATVKPCNNARNLLIPISDVRPVEKGAA